MCTSLLRTGVRALMILLGTAAPVAGAVCAYVVVEFFDHAGNPLPATRDVYLSPWSWYGPQVQFFSGDIWRTNNQVIKGIYLYGSTNLRAQLYLRAREDGAWAPQVYTNGSRCDEAVPIWVYAGQTTVVQFVRQRRGASVARVRALGQDHSVSCYDWESGAWHCMLLAGETNNAIEPGVYGLYGARGQWYPDSAVWGAAAPALVDAGQTTIITFQATGAVLVCRALAKDAPDTTVSDVYFYVSGAQNVSGSAYDGTRTWSDMPRGTYTLRAEPRGAGAWRYIAAYYKDALTTAEAAQITLWGAHTAVVDVLLPTAVGQITGTLTTAHTPAPYLPVEILATGTDDLSFAAYSYTRRGYGLGLPRGAFLLRARARGYVDWYYPGVEFSNYAARVDVTTACMYQIDVVFAKGGSIQGMASNFLYSSDYRAYACAVPAAMPGDEARALVKYPSTMWACPTTVTVGMDGAYVITGLATGAYRVCVMGWHRLWPNSAYKSWYPSNATFETAGIITITQRGDAVQGVDVYRHPQYVAAISSARIDVVVLEHGTDEPVEHAAVECTGLRVDSDMYGYAPALATNETCPMLTISRAGYESVSTAACDGVILTVRLARASAIFTQVRAGRWVDFTYDWRVVVALPDGRYVADAPIGISGTSALNVPAETGVVVLAGVPPGGVSGYANTFFGNTPVLSNAAALWLARGEHTNIVIDFQPRPASLVTSITHEAGMTVTVAVLQIPEQWAYAGGGWLTQRLAWLEWSMPPGARFDREVHTFTWVSDGCDYDTYIGRFTPPGEDNHDMSGACTLLRLRTVPEPMALAGLVAVVGVARRMRK